MNISEVQAHWFSNSESKKAWMSVRDADLLEQLILHLVFKRKGEPLRVIEWGGGRSTGWYTHLLDYFQLPYTWLMLEHDREFFDSQVRALLEGRNNTKIYYHEDIPRDLAQLYRAGRGLIAVVFDHGKVSPYTTGLTADRLVPMDAYVSLPDSLGVTCDLAIVDGRKRRRCVLEAAGLIGESGYVLLHDAWRKHYQSSWASLASHTRMGDEWWIGCNHRVDFKEILPWNAFDHPLLMD